MFGSDHYDELVDSTTALLDRLVDVSDDERMASLERIFERSIRYEGGFWDMAYGSPQAGSPDEGGTP